MAQPAPAADLVNPLVLFGQADIVVKIVILGLDGGEHLDVGHHRQSQLAAPP